MTRPVKGFLTKRGHYYDKKIDAQTRDAVDDFNEGLADYLSQYFLPPMVSEFISEHMRYFLVANRDIAEPYIKLVTEMPPEPAHVPIATAPVVPEPMLDLPEDVNDFLPEPDIDDTSSDASFTDTLIAPDGSEGANGEGYEDLRYASIPGEDAEE